MLSARFLVLRTLQEGIAEKKPAKRGCSPHFAGLAQHALRYVGIKLPVCRLAHA
jgi:hypothetical protein